LTSRDGDCCKSSKNNGTKTTHIGHSLQQFRHYTLSASCSIALSDGKIEETVPELTANLPAKISGLDMQYISTRGRAPKLGFNDVLLAGLANDGGLYVPEYWPQFSHQDLSKLRGKSYSDIAFHIIRPFLGGEISDHAFRKMVDEAYATFRHPAVAPLVQTGPNEFILELFHGPTLAFKDVAMQLISRLMDHVLAERGERATIVGATSGDTGGAAIEAFAGRQRTDMFILFPHGRVSPVQQRQMTSSGAANVHSIAIDGTFDDCQDLVKAMFNHAAFRADVGLSGVNSINWGRIMAQIVYYFTSALALGAPDRAVSFTVPTGNFGDIFAGYAAKQMGLPINRLMIATNDNDILARTLETGCYQMNGVVQTTSPSMDIQISSNFERLVFDAYGREADPVNAAMNSLRQSGSFELSASAMHFMQQHGFAAGRADTHQVATTLKQVLSQSGYRLDPHTATGMFAARSAPQTDAPEIILATAHPAKFPDAVMAAIGEHPALPEWLSDLMERKEHFTRLPNDQKIVETFIRENRRN
jgi:threonine synthase